MATFVKGNAVPNASGYELLEKVGESYNSLATASEINFEVSAMDFAAGDHLLAVKAKGDGVNYSDSDPSETVTYTVEAADGGWEVYSPDNAATVSEEGGVPTVTCTTNKAVVLMKNTTKAFSFNSPADSAADGGRMVICGRYGNNVLAFRPRGSSIGTNLQRYDYTTFGGAVLTTDASAVNTFAAGDKLSVDWSGNTARLYVNDVLQSSFDCSTYIASEGWQKCAGFMFTNVPASTVTLSNFTLA